MKGTMQISVAALLLLLLQAASAYKVETHARFSQKAATCSVLGDSAFMEALGLDGLEAEDPAWSKPVNIHDPEWIAKWIDEYNKTKNRYKSTIKTLIGWGAKFEDEEFTKRPLNHFFDPLDGRPIHPCPPFSDCNTSPDWALEDGMLQPDLDNQEQSLFDANDRLRYALGLADKDAREEAWAGFFQSLGMVIHHLQDMAQPQHVRNDEHCDSYWCGLIGHYNPSYYEEFTNDNRAGVLNKFPCGSYPRLDLKKFKKARDFWISDAHYGMAEFTSRNFVSAGTNFRWQRQGNKIVVAADGNYPQPDPQNGGAGLIEERIDICDPRLMRQGFQLCGELRFLGTQVTDALQGGRQPQIRV